MAQQSVGLVEARVVAVLTKVRWTSVGEERLAIESAVAMGDSSGDWNADNVGRGGGVLVISRRDLRGTSRLVVLDVGIHCSACK